MYKKKMDVENFTEQQIEEYRASFALFDKNGDGRITLEELMAVVAALDMEEEEEHVQQMIEDCDINGNGTIEFNEFLELMAKNARESDPKFELQQAFNVFDKDGDGFISREELRSVLESLGEPASPEQVEAMLTQVDVDGDGQINYSEFVTMMLEKG